MITYLATTESREILNITLDVKKREGMHIWGDLSGGCIDPYTAQFQLSHLKGEENRIIDAKRRYDKGMYGACQECKRPIEADRLSSIPYIATCRKCAYKSLSEAV